MIRFIVLATLIAACVGCCCEKPATYDRIERHDFNRLAVRLNLPLFWIADHNGNGAVDPDEVTTLRFYPTAQQWVADGAFTPDFDSAYAAIVALAENPDDGIPEGLDKAEIERRRLVLADLDHGINTLVYSDLRDLADDHRAFVAHMLEAADLIDRLYALQNGTQVLAAMLPADDPASHSLFRRNRGPACVAPRTYTNPACSAIPGAPTPQVDVYPAMLQQEEEFCASLEGELAEPFTVVRQSGDTLQAVPLTDAYGDVTLAIAAELEAAADVLTDAAEDSLRAYLRAAAQSFRDNQWEPADEAWAAMDARNSAWYLRIAPDEVYWEPCALKAGVHMTFARINPDSLQWQDKLTPVRQEMENSLAELIGAPYAAREVGFALPDFIDIVVNAGDDRVPLGATIGQSLPNWGAVASEGRGRTVAMSNLYTDADSLEIKSGQAASLLSEQTLQSFSTSPVPGLLGTILHEACHNLGPSHDYEVAGKVDSEVFGGSMASVLEELKAQSGALYFINFLHQRGIIDEQLARNTYVDSMMWAFGHISRGMYTSGGQRKAYSQLAAIQVGVLLESGALHFDPEAVTANGSDHGAFTIDFDAFPAATEELMRLAGRIKAAGDRATAETLAATHVDGDTVPQELIAERILRHPKASFVYALDLD